MVVPNWTLLVSFLASRALDVKAVVILLVVVAPVVFTAFVEEALSK